MKVKYHVEELGSPLCCTARLEECFSLGRFDRQDRF